MLFDKLFKKKDTTSIGYLNKEIPAVISISGCYDPLYWMRDNHIPAIVKDTKNSILNGVVSYQKLEKTTCLERMYYSAYSDLDAIQKCHNIYPDRSSIVMENNRYELNGFSYIDSSVCRYRELVHHGIDPSVYDLQNQIDKKIYHIASYGCKLDISPYIHPLINIQYLDYVKNLNPVSKMVALGSSFSSLSVNRILYDQSKDGSLKAVTPRDIIISFGIDNHSYFLISDQLSDYRVGELYTVDDTINRDRLIDTDILKIVFVDIPLDQLMLLKIHLSEANDTRYKFLLKDIDCILCYAGSLC